SSARTRIAQKDLALAPGSLVVLSGPSLRSGRQLVLLQLAVPIQEVAPALVQIAGRKGAAVLLQLDRRRLDREALQEHAALAHQPVALEQVARAAGGEEVARGGTAAARLRQQVVGGGLGGREGAGAVRGGGMGEAAGVRAW